MFTVDKTSWHYRMAKLWATFANSWGAMPDNICSYWRAVVFGTLLFTILGFVAGGFVVYNLLGVLLMFTGGWGDSGIFAALNFITALITLVIGLCFTVDFLCKKYTSRPVSDAPPTLVGTWYKSFKDKTCVFVEYK